MISRLITYPVDLFTVHLSLEHTHNDNHRHKIQSIAHAQSFLPNEKITKPNKNKMRKKKNSKPKPPQKQPTNTPPKPTKKQKILSMDD